MQWFLPGVGEQAPSDSSHRFLSRDSRRYVDRVQPRVGSGATQGAEARLRHLTRGGIATCSFRSAARLARSLHRCVWTGMRGHFNCLSQLQLRARKELNPRPSDSKSWPNLAKPAGLRKNLMSEAIDCSAGAAGCRVRPIVAVTQAGKRWRR